MIARFSICDIKPISKQRGTRQGKTRDGRRVFYLTEDYRVWKEAVARIATVTLNRYRWPICTRSFIRSKIVIRWPNYPMNHRLRIGDVADNIMGGIYDALTKIAYFDDRLVIDAHHVRTFEKLHQVDVELETITEGEAKC